MRWFLLSLIVLVSGCRAVVVRDRFVSAPPPQAAIYVEGDPEHVVRYGFVLKF